jgi:hypothetical protein
MCDENKLPNDGRNWVYGNSSTTTLRKHLETYHPDEYLEVCTTHGWPIAIESLRKKSHQQMQQRSIEASKAREAVTAGGLLQHLVNWIAADDQVCTASHTYL